MSKVKFKLVFKVDGKEDGAIRQAVNEKFSTGLVDYGSVPRIAEFINLKDFAESLQLTQEEVQWLSAREHKYQIENVNKCDGYIEVELDLDKVWPEEA